MTMPTAAQIEAAVALPTYQVQRYDSGSWVDVSSDIVNVAGDYTASASSDNGLGFGMAPAPTQEIEFAREQNTAAWDGRPVKVSLGFNGNNPLHFLGLISGVRQTGDGGSWSATGYRDLISAAPEIRTPLLYRRAVFTKTTATSNENPDNVGAKPGLGNILLWRAGGRPWAQAASYPSALFLYHCDQAVLAPDWTWTNGGDPAETLDELCRACGGILYQRTDGVVVYQEPMAFGGGSAAIHYTDSAAAKDANTRVTQGLAQYGDISREGNTRLEVVDVVRCAYTERRLQGRQQVYENKVPRQVEAGQALTLTLDLQLPCLNVNQVVVGGFTHRSARAATTSELTVAIGTAYAQQVSVTLTNTTGETIGISSIIAYGQPLIALEEATASYGTAGTTPRSYSVRSSAYIQTASHARRLCRMHHDFFSSPRLPVTLSGCGYDPRRQLGDIVLLTSAGLGLSASRHRVIGIRAADTGTAMDLIVAPVDGLPVAADFWQLGQTYADSDQRQLIY